MASCSGRVTPTSGLAALVEARTANEKRDPLRLVRRRFNALVM
jgi:hypothetical protein